MTVTKTYCDHCGKELDEMHGFTDEDIEIGLKHIECDLCSKCIEELARLVMDFCTNETVMKGA